MSAPSRDRWSGARSHTVRFPEDMVSKLVAALAVTARDIERDLVRTLAPDA